MLELIYYGLFLLLYGFGAWMFFNGLQDYTKSKGSKHQPSLFDIGNMKPGTVCTAKHPGGIGEIDGDAPSHDDPGVTEIANEERVRIEPRVRNRVKSYLRDMENEGKLKRVMNVREYFYVVAEEENEEVVSESGHVGVFQANEQNEAIV
jgi:hypothetical protein